MIINIFYKNVLAEVKGIRLTIYTLNWITWSRLQPSLHLAEISTQGDVIDMKEVHQEMIRKFLGFFSPS